MRTDAVTSGTSERNYGLDVLKIIATVLIIFHHYQQAFEVLYSSGINFYGGSWFYWGILVELFFMISGYVTVKYIPLIQAQKISLKDWYIKKVIRLLPLVALSVLVYESLLYIHSPICDGCSACGDAKVNVWGAIITALGLQAGGVFRNPMINDPTWYISVLIIAYVVFYIVTLASQKFGIPVWYAYIAMILLGCGIQTYGISLPYLNSMTGRGYAGFFMGVLIAMYVKKYGISKKLSILSFSVSALVVYLCLFHSNGVEAEHRNLLSFILFPSMVLSTESNAVKKLFHHDFWRIWGQCSYNAFVWHIPMILVLALAADFVDIAPYIPHRKTMYLFALLVETVGVVSHFAIEKPLTHAAKRVVYMISAAHTPCQERIAEE